jgi:single-stranded-DNA-specific exonuclease
VNRTLVRHGLHELAHGSRIATGALRQVIGHREDMVTPWDIHFRFAPRINAASRMGRQEVVLEWLSSRMMKDACDLALQMEDLNRKRIAVEEGVFREAVEEIERDDFQRTSQAIVLANRDWHAGILGIVASRIVERYRKPSILLTWKEGHWEGSGRSTEGFHLHKALKHCAGHLERFGGHAIAVGLKVSEESLPNFIRAFTEYAANGMAGVSTDEPLSLHAPLPLSQINDATIAWMERLGPFGHGCAEPVFWAESVNILRRDVIREQHVRLMLGQNGKRFSAIAFRMAQQLPPTVERLDACIFVPMRKTWAGQNGIQLRVLDCVSQNGP